MSLEGEKGSTQAEVYKTFTERLNDLQTVLADSCSKGFRGQGLRKWYLPDKWLDNDLRLFDVENFYTEAFDRTELNNLYDKIMSSEKKPGTSGDVISLKNQIDYLAAEERALNFRHASPVRCLVYSQMRRHGHSVSNIFPNILNQCASAIQNGGQ